MEMERTYSNAEHREYRDSMYRDRMTQNVEVRSRADKTKKEDYSMS